MVLEEVEPVTGLTVAAVARRMGVAPATLRTWDRRYGIGPGVHEAGTHRRYSEADLARLEHMRRLVISGVPPADAARAANAASPTGSAASPTLSAASPTLSAASSASLAADPADAAPASGHRAGGGRVIAHPGATPAQRGLARAAQALDTLACERIIEESIARRGVVWSWDRLILPVLIAVGNQWQQTGSGIEVEHALSSAVHASLSNVARSLTRPVNVRTVLLASAPADPHTLPLAAVSAALAERRIASRTLGANLPTAALAVAIERLGPAAVFVWAQIPGTADAAALAELPDCRPRSTILAGGQGWAGDLPPGVVGVVDLSDTVARIAHAVGE